MEKVDVLIIGAGAAGLFCAIEAGKRQRKVIVLDHANKPGKKILMSGGGRCNFTNYDVTSDNFISHNPHFCKSALSRYTPWDFIELVKQHKIPFHEKTKGQLFCDHKSHDILDMLLQECQNASVEIRLNTQITSIEKISDDHYKIHTNRGHFHCASLVIATGGLSIPTMGASSLGYQLAEQFGIAVWPTSAGLVPLTLHTHDKARYAILSGVALESEVSILVTNGSAARRETASNRSVQIVHEDCEQLKQRRCRVIGNEYHRCSFRDHLLFTHRGLSGPAVLQMSSYWQAGEKLDINLLPDVDLMDSLKSQKSSLKLVKNSLLEYLPKRVIDIFLSDEWAERKLSSLSDSELDKIAAQFQRWSLLPNGTEGYRTAEVTLGGVNCDAISSKTMEAHDVPGLYFIGEVLDVSGWLGGYNFQWAWSSGWAAGQVV